MKISRFGWSLFAVSLLAVAAAAPARAQEQRTNAPATHTVKRGDTLWDIAKQYLGDPYLWPGIYRLNTDQIEDPHWIYPGEVLRLPGQPAAPAVVAEEPPRVSNSTVFSRVQTRTATRLGGQGQFAIPRVPPGDVVRAAYVGPDKGPRGAGKVLFGAEIPGIDKERAMTNYQLYDRLLLIPPVGSVAAERERFVAYELGESLEGMGTVVIPTAVLQVIRAPRNGEAATVQVVELFGMLNADTRVIPMDTAGAGASAAPMSFSGGRTTTVRAIYRPAVLPSTSYEVLFDLSSKDGMKIGDEVQIFRARQKDIPDERPAVPEVTIATARVVRVTPYGSTARVTSQTEPAIRVGEGIRVTARMP